jgi:hypothetical protein
MYTAHWNFETGSTTPSEAEFLNEIQTKVFRVFLIAIHLYSFAFRYIFLQTHAAYYIYLFKLMQPVIYFYMQFSCCMV